MSRSSSREAPVLVYGAIPRAQLMPPEVAQRKHERNRRRGLITLVMVVLLAVVGGIIGSFLFAAQAEQSLAAERAVTQDLLNQQLEFSELLEIQARLSGIETQRTLLDSVEVPWRSAMSSYLTVLAADGVIDGVTLLSNDPYGEPLVLAGPLRSPRSATAQVTVLTAGLPNAAAWLRAFETFPAFADASFDTSLLEQEEGYLTIITLNLSSEALAVPPVEEETS
jgi:hypothetical protein